MTCYCFALCRERDQKKYEEYGFITFLRDEEFTKDKMKSTSVILAVFIGEVKTNSRDHISSMDCLAVSLRFLFSCVS